MIIFLNKKRILTITICLVLSFFLAGIKEKNETIETVALPVEDKVIIIDAGHGGVDGGAVGKTGVSESGWARLEYNGQIVYCIDSFLMQ